MSSNRVRLAIAVAVTGIWAASYIISLVNHLYHPPPELNGLMLIVSGFFFASGMREQQREISTHEQKEIVLAIEEEHEREAEREAARTQQQHGQPRASPDTRG